MRTPPNPLFSKEGETDKVSGGVIGVLYLSIYQYNYPVYENAEVAQLVEHSPEERGVDSSSLSLGISYYSKFISS